MTQRLPFSVIASDILTFSECSKFGPRVSALEQVGQRVFPDAVGSFKVKISNLYVNELNLEVCPGRGVKMTSVDIMPLIDEFGSCVQVFYRVNRLASVGARDLLFVVNHRQLRVKDYLRVCG